MVGSTQYRARDALAQRLTVPETEYRHHSTGVDGL
jgi:hypothetical protein